MKILALDLSTKATGVAVFDEATLIEYRCLRESDQDVYLRMVKISQEVELILREREVEIVVMEDVPMGEGVAAQIIARKLWFLQGMIVNALIRLGIPFVFYQPSQWRQIMGFNLTAYRCRTCGNVLIRESGANMGPCPQCGTKRANQYDRKTLNGRDEMKERAVRYVNDRYNLMFKYFKTDTKKNPTNDNEAEAICLGLAYIKKEGKRDVEGE